MSSVSTSAEQIFSLRLSFEQFLWLLKGHTLLHMAAIEISDFFEKLKSNMIVPGYNIKNLLTAAAYFQLQEKSWFTI